MDVVEQTSRFVLHMMNNSIEASKITKGYSTIFCLFFHTKGGSPETLYESVHKLIFNLPSNFRLYPAHDYTGRTVTTVAEERILNPRLNKTKDEFIKIMNNLNLSYPKMIGMFN